MNVSHFAVFKACFHALQGCTVFVLLSVVLLACAPKEPWEQKDAAKVLENFLISVENQDRDSVWEFLKQQDRDALERLGQKAGLEGKDMLNFGHVLSSTREYKRFETVQHDDSRALVAIQKHDGSQIELELNKERGHWVVGLDIAQALAESTQQSDVTPNGS